MTATVAVLGPGAVGGALAVPLALAGNRVVCVAPPATAAAIARDGLTLDRPGETLRAEPEATEELREPVDLLLVTVKAPELEPALDRVHAAAATVLPLLNGLEHVDRIRAALGGRVVAGTIGRLEAYREGPTWVVQTTPAPLVTLAAEDVAAALLRAAGFEVRIGAGERAVLWEKLARLAPLAAATVATGLPVGELRSDPELRRELDEAIAEACAVAAADGVDLAPGDQWAVIEAMPATLTTSAARDAEAGRLSELDAITGSVVRAGSRLDVPTPVLERLFEEAWRPQSP